MEKKSIAEIEASIKLKREHDARVRENARQVETLNPQIKSHLDKLDISVNSFNGLPYGRAKAIAFTHLALSMYAKLGMYQNLSMLENTMRKHDISYKVVKI